MPTGRIVRIEPWGDVGAIYVEGEHRAFAAYVFELDNEAGDLSDAQGQATAEAADVDDK